jgi:hypothetical protein
MKLNLTYANNAKWANKEHTLIDVVVRFEEINEDLPFTADPNDTEEHGRDIYAKAKAGEFGVIAEYVAPPPLQAPPAPTVEQLQAQLAVISAQLQLLQGV